MVIVYFILFFLYMGLTLLYFFTLPKPPAIGPWPILSSAPADLVVPGTCQVDSDCESYHVCLSNTCVPKLLRGGKCDLQTGQWISYKVQNKDFATCSCKDTQLFSQRFFGGDCNVPVACGAHGTYNVTTQSCDCNPGFTPVGLTCQKLPVFQQMQACGPDELEVAKIDNNKIKFHPIYFASLQKSAKCVKRPCSFDALSGRPLKHGKYDPEWGCVCDPRYGYFGVALEGVNKNYLQSKGFDACSSIFVNDPKEMITIGYVTYYYVGIRSPISIILFPNLQEADLIPFLKGKSYRHLMITQKLWRYDYAQYFFKTKKHFRTHFRFPRYVIIGGWIPRIVNGYYERFELQDCKDLYDFYTSRINSPATLSDAYQVLYNEPVCRISKDYEKIEFRDRVVVNPFHMTFHEHDDVDRYNAFFLKYNSDEVDVEKRWSLKLDFAYDIDRYKMSMITNVPDWSP